MFTRQFTVTDDSKQRNKVAANPLNCAVWVLF